MGRAASGTSYSPDPSSSMSVVTATSRFGNERPEQCASNGTDCRTGSWAFLFGVLLTFTEINVIAVHVNVLSIDYWRIVCASDQSDAGGNSRYLFHITPCRQSGVPVRLYSLLRCFRSL